MLKKRLLVTAVIGLFAVSGFAHSNGGAHDHQEIKKIAKNAIKSVGGKLQATLLQKVKEGGFAKAAEFCSIEATPLAKEAAANLPQGVSIKRITDKPRNPNNKATEMQMAVLAELEMKKNQGMLPKMLVKKISNNEYQVYKPLIMGKKCLNCHGDSTTRNKEAYEIISQKYPNDKAIDYKLGDLRGAFLVNIIK